MMLEVKLTFVISVFLRVWLVNGYSFEDPVKQYLSIVEDPTAEMQTDAICDGMLDDTRKELCKGDAIEFCKSHNIQVTVDPKGTLGEKKMYKFEVDSGSQPRGVTYIRPACSCPTSPIIYFGEVSSVKDAIRISVKTFSKKLSKKRSSESTSSGSGQESSAAPARRRSPRFIQS